MSIPMRWMISAVVAVVALIGAPGAALAQPAVLCPTAPSGDSSNRCASTQFVQSAVGGGTTIPANTVLGSIGGGTPAALTKTQVTTLINAFTTTLSGAVPSPGSVAGKVLSDNGTWVTAGSGTVTSVVCGTGLTGGTITATGTCAADIASQANIWTAASNKVLDAATVFNSAGALVSLGGTASAPTIDLNTGFNFSFNVTSGTAFTLQNPTNTKVGQTGCIFIRQPQNNTVAAISYQGNWKFSGGASAAPALTAPSTSYDVVDMLCYFVMTSTFIVGTMTKDVR